MKKQLQHIVSSLQSSFFSLCVKGCNLKFALLLLLITANFQLTHAQLYPVQTVHNIIPPYNTKLNDYATSTAIKLRLRLILNDNTVSNRQVRLKLKIQGNGLNIQSTDFVVGAPFIFLNGGTQQELTNIELSAYFQLNNLLGINAQQYNQPLPDGVYRICWEVYDFLTNQLISNPNMGCDTVFLLLNDPPFLNLPNRGDQLTSATPYINFQWTPRHANATNVSYEFELRELWDSQIDPQAAFLASPNYYTQTTYSTTLLYGIGLPELFPGKTYAWRVRAISSTGLSENSVFRNNGYSEIYHFTYANECYPPTMTLAEPLNTDRVKITWQGHADHNKYHVQYKRADVDDAEWFEIYSYSNQTQIGNLQAGVTYDFRVGGTCHSLTDLNQGYSYSTPNQFTMPTPDETVTYTCGIVPEIEITNQTPLGNLGVNETFTAGDFPVTVKIIQGGNGTYTGKGYIVVPYLADTKIAVEFTGIRINTDHQLFDGIIKTTYDPTWSGVEDVGDMFNGGDGQVNVTEVDFIIGEIVIDPNGDILIVGVGGAPIVELPGGEDYIITDSGDLDADPPIPAQSWAVDEEGNITPLGEQAEGGGTTANNTDGVNSNGEATSISAQGVEVTFTKATTTQYPNKYGFDAYNPSQSVTEELYRKLGNYYMPYKAVAKGQDDYIIANLNISNDSIQPYDLIFKTKDGVALTKIDSTATTYTLKLRGILSDADIETHAVIKQGDKYQIAGAFMQYQVAIKEVDVVLVNTANTDTEDIKTNLKRIYKQGVLNLNITVINDFTSDLDGLTPDGTIQSGESGFLANYTSQQQSINSAIKSRSDYNQSAYYLILTDKNPSTANQKGLMPIGRQFGYIYTSNRTTSSITHTAAHELGHGAFQLKHPFSTHSYAWSQGATNWLLDYNNGEHLPYAHWKNIHNPNIHISIFDGDGEGEYRGGYLISKIIQELRCKFKNNDDTIDSKLDEYIDRATFYEKSWGKESRAYHITILKSNDGGYTPISCKISIGRRNSNSFINQPPITPASKHKIYGYTYEYDLGGIIIWSDFDIINETDGSEFIEYLTAGNYTVIDLYTENEPDGDITEEQTLEEVIITAQSLNTYIASLVSDNDISNRDFKTIKSIASCDATGLSLDTRFLIIKLISEKWIINEKKEDLVLDLLSNIHAQDDNALREKHDALLDKFKLNPTVYIKITRGIDDFIEVGENNKDRLYDELFTIWLNSSYYQQYHASSGGNYDVNNRNDEFYREIKIEIESFILENFDSDCINRLEIDSVPDICECLEILSVTQIQQISYEDRKGVIEKILKYNSPTNMTPADGLSGYYERSIIRLIKYIPENFDHDGFMNYLVETPITYLNPQIEEYIEISLIKFLFNQVDDSFFVFSGDYRKELMEGFIELKSKSNSFNTKIQEIKANIEDFDIDKIKENLTTYSYDYRNILRRLLTSASPFQSSDFYTSLETVLDDNNGESPATLTIKQTLKNGAFTSIQLSEKTYNPFDLILFLNLSKQPLLSNFSNANAEGKKSATMVPAIVAHYASEVGNNQTQEDLVQSAVDVASLFIPGGQLNAIGKVFYYADKVSTLASLAGTYNRYETPKLASVFNKISLATGGISLGDLANTGYKTLIKNKADNLRNLTLQQISTNLDEQATDIINIVNNHPDEISNVLSLDGGANKIDELAEVLEAEKLALGDVISGTQKQNVEDAVTALRTLAEAVGKLFNDVDIVALNKIIPSGANKSYLGKTIINTPNNSIKSIPSTNSPLLQKVDNYIAQTNSNLKGQIGEEIAEELVKDMDGFVHYPCKLNGSDNGFDVVAIKGSPSNPVEIRIIESKPMNSGSVNLSVTVNKGTQMDDFWIDKTIEAMRNSSDQNLIDIGNNLFYNRDKITKLISTIDKTSKEVILIKLDAF